MPMIYFDHNATTKIAPQVLAKMNEAYSFPLNASAVHQLGQKASGAVENARNELKNSLNAQNYEVVFTSSATEASNNVLQGCGAAKIFISAAEHASIYNCRPAGVEVVEVGVDENGTVDIAKLELGNAGGNFLLCATLAQNETGVIQPIAEIAQKVHQNGGLIHCDIVQAVGKIPVDLEKLNVDFAAVSAHKFGGPQGVGALLIRKGLELKPLIFGSGQEKSRRSGTLNVAGIIGFGEACRLTASHLEQFQKIAELRDFLESELKKNDRGNDGESGGESVKIFGENAPRIANTSFFATKNCDSQTQLINFDLHGICVSAGAACSSGSLRESRILKAMKVAPEFSTSAIRVSLGLSSARSEVEKFISAWKALQLRIKN